jgi:exopolysaccharide biosynthesis polyprenyl glycosylphosphotransferase
MTMQNTASSEAHSTDRIRSASHAGLRRLLSESTELLFRASLRRPLSILALVAIDALALFGGLAIAAYYLGILRDSEGQVPEGLVYVAPVLVALWLAVFAAHNLYDQTQSRRNPVALLKAIFWGSGLLAAGVIVYPEIGFVLTQTLLAAFCVALLTVGLRFSYEQAVGLIYRRGLGRVPTLVIGRDEERARVRQLMEKKPGVSTCVGELNTNGEAISLPSLRQVLDRTGARSVILAGTERLSDVQFLDLLRSMSLRRVKVNVVPNAVALLDSRPLVSRDLGIPLLELGYPRLNSTQWVLKRLLDVAGSLAGLVILSPLLIGVAVLIKVTSSGPVFFKQKRVGADEKIFVCYKFRSMYIDAEARQAELEAQNEADGAIFKIRNDPRVTPVGRFIRRCSIDELPQLINVLKGEMSLVGPRPLPIRDFELMGELHKKRLATVPGVTGYWQISGRSELSFEDMVQLDLYYIENWSLFLDIQIILKTIGIVLRCKGAY